MGKMETARMKKSTIIALLAASSFLAGGSAQYEPIISQNELDRIIYRLPDGVEVERIPAQLGFCGKTATVVMDEYGYQIWCGEYTFKRPELQIGKCLGEYLERRIPLTEITDKWTDADCDRLIEMYEPYEGNAVSYLDYSTVQMIEGMGMRAEGDIVENAERFIDAANEYAIILLDMNLPKAEKLWVAYMRRHRAMEEIQEDESQ